MTVHNLGVVLACASILGCAGELEDPARFAVQKDCAEDPVGFVHETCGAGACHVAGNTFNVADLASPGATTRLVDHPPTASQTCSSDTLMGELLIDSVDPAMSFVLNKLTTNPVCGSQMPFLATPLTQAQIACVATYVDMVIAGTVDQPLNPADAATDAATDANP